MNSKNIAVAAIIGFIFAGVTPAAFASTVVRTGESVSVESEQKIEGDFYAAASILNISGQASEDAVAVGGRVTLNGSVAKDALFAGGSVDVHGPVGDDLRIIGSDVVIAEPVTGDVFVIAKSVTILDTASIGGDLVVYGSIVEVDGSVGGNILGQVETMRIDAPVKGAIDIAAAQVTLGDRADITGTLRYTSNTEIARSQNAKVQGAITRNDPQEQEESGSVKAFLIPLLVVLFSSLVWYLIARQLLVRISDRAFVRGIRPFATGFITLCAAPVVLAVLVVTILGTLVGVAGIIAYLFALLITLFSVGAVFGQMILFAIKKRKPQITPYVVGLGVIALGLLSLIPVLGPLTILLLGIITLGALVDIILHP